MMSPLWWLTPSRSARDPESRVIPNVNPRYFPPGQPVTDCSDTGVTFGG
jgi:hypothetical protein